MMGTSDRPGAGARIGDYVVDRELAARPGFVAYGARHVLLPRRARILAVHPAFAELPGMSLQLVREACILEVLRHPGVPRVYECGLAGDQGPWVATELIEGPTIATLLAQEGPLSVPAVLGLLAEISEILHYTHARGCIHRNLRPAVIARRAEGPCILDWADARGHEAGPASPVVPETLDYQPPEVIAGAPADRRADVFALGAVAYEALGGARSPMSAARRFPGAPARLCALIDRMLAPDPIARPTSAEVRAEAIGVIEQIEVLVPPPEGSDGGDGSDGYADEVEVEEVELGAGLAVDSDAEPPPPAREARLRWTPLPGTYRQIPRAAAAPPQPQSGLAADPSARTQTEPMLSSVELSRTKTEPMPAQPEPPPPAAPPLGKLAPARPVEPPRRKST